MLWDFYSRGHIYIQARAHVNALISIKRLDLDQTPGLGMYILKNAGSSMERLRRIFRLQCRRFFMGDR